ncbi:Glucose-inhibited division protein A [Anaerohalosphaera lusitana]|uniref:tRNA uridine 5-carboxymethylaminomethyl modification enzyme MnmG n=1 Tax=Anaerohalosphaera lusitana TaxID=1936003 RepID=A0A1U9NK14_9BACT|nr:tRNA uridine-5-carboxymethylaminomethyl(34) synthesis enzyme MnmG [Anaerohalosphaera lusitana]AQT68155.1 Glucose-inhibited division protein A [Anaerohalosphaera lusitana]
MSGGRFECIIVGGGHAGAEAAHAAGRMGADTLLITHSRETIAKMSCNPAIGGIAKGQIAREVDALGGLMGQAIDATGIQFRMLNRSKGPAVRSPRAQADKDKYKDYVRGRLEATEGLTIVEGEVDEVLVEDGWTRGVRCADGVEYYADAVVITAGTFLRGVMHMGEEQWAGGRIGEKASNALSDCLRGLGFELGRLKTGTPVRIAGDTIDYDKCERQPGDDEIVPFSFMTEGIEREQVPCWITWTNERIHDLLRANLHRAPMYTGQISSEGPRYCPSIETKIERFADKKRHQVFLEPEDEAGKTVYCNGISTSVPKDVQEEMMRMLPGTERARITTYAYAIEYDYSPARQLRESLETRAVEGLFFAGQINGTSGYEEAAGQGLVAGVNAVRKVRGEEPMVLGRDQAYVGVLIDDLLTKEITEPYRMFTSRAEYRLTLRADNADRRLTPIGREMGVVCDERWARYGRKVEELARLREYLKKTKREGKALWHLLKGADAGLGDELGEHEDVIAMGVGADTVAAAVVDAKYEGYLVKQAKQIESFRKLENVRLPADLDFAGVTHLRNEAKGKLAAFRPATLGQASRIGGITPADITVLQIELKRRLGGSG